MRSESFLHSCGFDRKNTDKLLHFRVSNIHFTHVKLWDLKSLFTSKHLTQVNTPETTNQGWGDHIIRDYMDRRVTLPKRVTTPT